jgi:hypothetical protein
MVLEVLVHDRAVTFGPLAVVPDDNFQELVAEQTAYFMSQKAERKRKGHSHTIPFGGMLPMT